MPGSLRAVLRLFGVVGTTFWHFLRLVFAPRAYRTEPALQAKRVQEWAQALCRVCGLRIQFGKGGPPPQGVVLVSNHRSYADIFVLAATSPMLFLAKKELEGWPFFGRAARMGGTVFVDRGNRQSGSQAMQALAERLRAGANVAVFPEGTTYAAPGTGPFKSGSFRLAAAERMPVIPVAMEYERPEDAWTDPEDSSFASHFIACFSRPVVHVRLNVGPEMRSDDPELLRAQASEWITAHLEAPTAEAEASAAVPA